MLEVLSTISGIMSIITTVLFAIFYCYTDAASTIKGLGTGLMEEQTKFVKCIWQSYGSKGVYGIKIVMLLVFLIAWYISNRAGEYSIYIFLASFATGIGAIATKNNYGIINSNRLCPTCRKRNDKKNIFCRCCGVRLG